jgi:hypothetical protein
MKQPREEDVARRNLDDERPKQRCANPRVRVRATLATMADQRRARGRQSKAGWRCSSRQLTAAAARPDAVERRQRGKVRRSGGGAAAGVAGAGSGGAARAEAVARHGRGGRVARRGGEQRWRRVRARRRRKSSAAWADEEKNSDEDEGLYGGLDPLDTH